jgi:predicted  nucleic acid-binding Zn-ribbon protein
MQVCMYAGMQIYRYTSRQVCRQAGIPENPKCVRILLYSSSTTTIL